jgi:hypothetical protein
MSTATEYAWTHDIDRDIHNRPVDQWRAHRIVKTTAKRVYVELRPHPWNTVVMLDRVAFERNGATATGLWHMPAREHFYSSVGKAAFEAERQQQHAERLRERRLCGLCQRDTGHEGRTITVRPRILSA